VPLKTDLIFPWSRALELYELSRSHKKDFAHFGYGIKIPAEKFADTTLLRKKYNFRDDLYILYTTPRSREFPIHVDGTPGENNVASINWPILGCDEASPTQWYRVDHPKYKILDGSHFLENTEDAIELHSEAMLTRLQVPYLFRSDLWHRGFNTTNGIRVILKWELQRPNWDDAVREFIN
jgi:hypothetical protein